jgi:peroxiredoxin
LVGFEQHKEALAALGGAVVCASVDPIDRAREVANEVSFPVGYGVTREIADRLGSWWEERRQIIQPSEFILGPDDKVVVSSYSDGPLGRLVGEDVVRLVGMYVEREK